MPGRPEITGFTKPAMEGDVITLTCTTSGSKPAANIRWFRNDKEVQGKRAAPFPPGCRVVRFSICTVFAETSLLSRLVSWAAAAHCTGVCALFLWLGGLGGGGCRCVELPGLWPTSPLLSAAAPSTFHDVTENGLTKCSACFGFFSPGHVRASRSFRVGFVFVLYKE